VRERLGHDVCDAWWMLPGESGVGGSRGPGAGDGHERVAAPRRRSQRHAVARRVSAHGVGPCWEPQIRGGFPGTGIHEGRVDGAHQVVQHLHRGYGMDRC